MPKGVFIVAGEVTPEQLNQLFAHFSSLWPWFTPPPRLTQAYVNYDVDGDRDWSLETVKAVLEKALGHVPSAAPSAPAAIPLRQGMTPEMKAVVSQALLLSALDRTAHGLPNDAGGYLELLRDLLR